MIQTLRERLFRPLAYKLTRPRYSGYAFCRVWPVLCWLGGFANRKRTYVAALTMRGL